MITTRTIIIPIMEKKKIIRREVFTPAKLQLRDAQEGEEESRVIEGYAILFDTPSAVLDDGEYGEVREVISKDAVTEDFLREQDIKMTMYHNREILLARSNKGEGTLTYKVDDKGVFFSFEAPKTQHGDEALELVKRGDIAGCSFMFSTYYFDPEYVERVDSEGSSTYTVKRMTGVYDFTLTDCPAYPDTSVDAREAFKQATGGHQNPPLQEVEKQVKEMRARAKWGI